MQGEDSGRNHGAVGIGTPPTIRGDAPRALFGGMLMGLANLVPGISGGTMLLAAGIYPRFIGAVAELSLLRFRLRSIVLLGCVVAAALASIVLFARPVHHLVVHHRWIMFSLFIGLTLGGVPILLRMLRPARLPAWIGAAAGLVLMITLAITGGAESAGHHAAPGVTVLLLGGIAAGSAMILPGVSGSYLLLVLGLYLPILDAIGALRDGVAARESGPILASLRTIVPVGVGVVVSIVLVSNVLRFLLRRFEQATLGALLGLLIGAVAGLWPFAAPVPPAAGDVIRGRLLATDADAAAVPAKDWRTERFPPTAGGIALALLIAGGGFALSLGIDRSGGRNAPTTPAR